MSATLSFDCGVYTVGVPLPGDGNQTVRVSRDPEGPLDCLQVFANLLAGDCIIRVFEGLDDTRRHSTVVVVIPVDAIADGSVFEFEYHNIIEFRLKRSYSLLDWLLAGNALPASNAIVPEPVTV